MSSSSLEIGLISEEWWEISQEEETLHHLDKLYKDERLKRALKQSILLECVSVSLVYCISLHINTPPKQILSELKQMFYYVH